MSHDAQQAYLKQESERISTWIAAARSDGGSRSLTVKRMQQLLAQAEERLKAKLSGQKDTGITFEMTGIDYLFIDEAHDYKNLRTPSNIPGVAIDGSQRASDLHMKLDYLRGARGHRVATLATATPIANSIAEAYTMQLAVLDKIDDHEVVGIVDRVPIDLMPLSTADDHAAVGRASGPRPAGSATTQHAGTTDIDPRELADDDVQLWASLHLPGMEVVHALDDPDGQPIATVAFSGEERASLSHRAIEDQLWPVVQQGRRPWDHVEAAVRAFQRAGRPTRERLRISARIGGTQQRVWLDDLGSGYSWPLPSAP